MTQKEIFQAALAKFAEASRQRAYKIIEESKKG